MLVNDAFNNFLTYQEANNEPATVKAYRDKLHQFLHGYNSEADLRRIVDIPDSFNQASIDNLVHGHGERELEAVRPEDIDNWLLILKKQRVKYQGNNRPTIEGKLAKATIEGRKTALKQFFHFCELRVYIARSPALHVKVSRNKKGDSGRHRKMNMYDLFKILDVARQRSGQGQHRDLALVCLIAESGARPGEVVSMNLSTLDLERLEAIVDGKEGVRTIVFSPHTARCLSQWLQFRQLVVAVAPAGQVDHDAVFIDTWPPHIGKRIMPGTINKIFQGLGKKAKVEGVCSPYSVRHLVGHHLAMSAPLPVVQEVMGHSDINTTMTYVHADLSQAKAVLSLHSPMNEYYGNGR